RHELPADPCAAAARRGDQPGDRPVDPLRPPRAARPHPQFPADAILVAERHRDDQPQQRLEPGQRRADPAIDQHQPLCQPVGGVPGRMHGLCRHAEPVRHPQRRRDPRRVSAVQRRVQESRRDRRHRRLDQRRSLSGGAAAIGPATAARQRCRLATRCGGKGVSMAVLRSLGLLLLLAASVCAAQPPRHSAAVAPEKAAPAPAPVPGIGIAAVVNDDVISVYDLAERMRLVMLSSNIADTPEARQRIGAQVLRGLIDEKLQLQEAKRQGVTASEAEIKKAFEQIEKQNNMRPGQLDEFLKSRGIDRNTLIQQITATLVWGKLVRRLAAQTVTVSDEEIDEAMKRVKEHAKEPESRVAEIFLAVDNPAQDEEVRRLAEKLIEQMRAGARFSAIAQQFSQSATAAVGGDMGWVRPDQLAPELGKVEANLKPGELSPPIRTGAGYYLLLVLERRNGAGGGGGSAEEPVYDIVQVVFPVAASAGEAA